MSDSGAAWLRALTEVEDSAFDGHADAQFAGVTAKLRARRTHRWVLGGLVGVAGAAATLALMAPSTAWMSDGPPRATIAVDHADPSSAERSVRSRPEPPRAAAERGADVRTVVPARPAPLDSPPGSTERRPTKPVRRAWVPTRKPAKPEPEQPRWRIDIRDGHAAQALDTMDGQTWVDFLRRATAEELLAVAHAARGAKRTKRARGALSEIRDRFPQDELAERATFLLGRVEAELALDPDAAHQWFARYVREFPEGQFVERARGRVLRALAHDGPERDAQRAAHDYLEHHPNGAYASLAERLIESKK